MWKVTPGTTSYRGFRVRILDASTGAPYTGATSATSGASFGYTRPGSTRTSISLSDLAAVDSAYSSGGMKHIGSGWYRLDLPDAAIAAGVDGVLIDGAFTSYVVVAPPVLLETTQTGDSYARIGAAGAGLTAVPWNAAWDAEVQSEAADALTAYAPAVAGSAMTLASGAITAAVIATDAIDADAISADAVAEIAAGGSGATPATFWSYSNRTLTSGAAAVTAAVTGSSVTVYRGTRWSITLTGLADFTGYTGIYFGVKANPREDADTASVCLVKTTTGLIAFDGDDTITAGHAAITVNSTTSITITVEADATQYATPGQYEYAVKVLNASGKPFMVSSGGAFNITSDIPLAIS